MATTGQGFLGCNMFAYCCNNPVTREDPDGAAFDTVFDILSLGASIADVISNPRDPWAWAGLAGDVIDVAVPFVTGVGEVTRAAKVAKETAEAVDDAHDAMKAVSNMADVLPGACFIAGTLVSVEDGYKAIEDIEVGDHVWAWDEETGEVALKQVVETYVRASNELIHIFVNGEEIITTPDHPFYVPVKGWTDAANLRAGDILVLVNGEYVIVEKVQHEILETPVTVYNFQVEDFHTYFVSEICILVHNSCAIVSHEIVLEMQPTREAGMNMLVKELDKTGAFTHGSLPYMGRLEKSYGYQKQIGRISFDKKVNWRLDYDPVKGVHYNIENYLLGKGGKSIKLVIPVNISYDDYKSIIDLWN